MWILDFIPNTVFHIISLIGFIVVVLGFLLTFLAEFSKFNLMPIQILGTVLLALGMWYEGGISKENQFKVKAAELEAEVLKSRLLAEQASAKIVTKVVTKKQIIQQQGDTVVSYIDREIVKYNNVCSIPQKLIWAHDAAAQNKPELLNPAEGKNEATIPATDHNSLVESKVRLAPKK